MKDIGRVIDRYVSSFLEGKFKRQSRRSFMSGLGRTVFRAAGIAVAARVGLEFRNMSARAAGGTGDWMYCGLHGYVCDTGNCARPMGGGTEGGAWSQCCKDPTCKLWVACSYQDVCHSAFPAGGYGTGCDGPAPDGSIPSWCGGAPNNKYWCTLVRCNTGGGDTTEAACKAMVGDICEMRICTKTVGGGTCYCRDTGGGVWKCCPGATSPVADCTLGAANAP